MLENNRLNELILRFPEDVQLIFKDMIPSYQLGYADYVYQTDNYATQNRRIKNLAKISEEWIIFTSCPCPRIWHWKLLTNGAINHLWMPILLVQTPRSMLR